MDRLGKLLRCPWSWDSGRCKHGVQGQDRLGMVLTIQQVAFPVHLLFCSNQGRDNTAKPTQLIPMLAQLQAEFLRYDIDITQIPLTLDSWFVSEPLRQRLYKLGVTTLIIAGKGHSTLTINHRKQQASAWKKELLLHPPTWGIDVPSCRLSAYHPTCGSVIRFFFHKSTTRSYSLMNLSQQSLRGAEIWHMWKQHHHIECFWKVLTSVFHMRAMHLHGNGLDTALLIKGLAYLFAIRLKTQRVFSKSSITQIIRTLSRDPDVLDVLAEHFHRPCLIT
jgi:hypothetical protein